MMMMMMMMMMTTMRMNKESIAMSILVANVTCEKPSKSRWPNLPPPDESQSEAEVVSHEDYL